MFASFVPIPDHLKRTYVIARIALWAGLLVSIIYFTFQLLFPTLTFIFNFRTPSASSNSLLDPHTTSNIPATNGKMEEEGTLITTASAVGKFSLANISLSLEKKSAIPTTLTATLQRSYRSFFLPTGEPITGFPNETLYNIDGIFYALRSGTLYPFVSTNAYLSSYPDTMAARETQEFLSAHPLSENWIGFRVGSLVSFADGVFIIVSDTEMRPIGSAPILLALGYRFEDVIPASEEEIGIYKRGRIIALGAEHSDGTLLYDRDTHMSYLIGNHTKRPLLDPVYHDFIASKQAPITVSSQASATSVSCLLEPSLWGQSFSCETPLETLQPDYGNDYHITLEKNDAAIDINNLQVSLITESSKQNMLSVLSQIKQRLLTRFGASQ